ncbi:MAG: carboxyl transferase domain-containing protein [Actinomycetes bacterium]
MATHRDDWEPILAHLDAAHRAATAMGGPERVARHRSRGKLDARQRIDALFDPGTFVEIGALVGSLTGPDQPATPADALVAGFGEIDGRPAVAGAEDFTVLGGSIGNGASDKRYRLCQLAAQERVPLVFMLEGAGHRLTNPAAGRRPNDLQGLADLSGLVPMVCLVLGASAGHGALTAPLSDFVVMTEESQLFTAGPPLVKAAIGEDVTKEELGGPQVHVHASGVAHNLVPDDHAAIALARRYLSYFPTNAWERPEVTAGPDTGPRRVEELLDLVPPDPRRGYSMRAVLDLVVDHGSLLEVQPTFGSAVVTALARLGGESVAIVANDPQVMAGTVDADAADKAAHFIGVADAFHLPLVLLADNPGVMAGTAAERVGALRHVARMFAAQHRYQGVKLHVTVRKAFGFGSSVMGMNPFDHQTRSTAFPAVTLGALPAHSGGASAKLDAAERERLAADQARGSFRVADNLGYDGVIDPRDLRDELLRGLRLSAHRRRGPADPVTHRGVLP